jgi:GNAT superfamily N-acetyltransferase
MSGAPPDSVGADHRPRPPEPFVSAPSCQPVDVTPFAVRRGDAMDAPILLALFDDAIRWMIRRGLTDQWGSTLFSAVPERVAAVQAWAASGGLRICSRDGRPAAAMVVGEAQPYVPPAAEPELYVVVLVGSPEPFARGAGAHLLATADDEAKTLGRSLVRVDCFAGNGGALVRFYSRCGFTPTDRFSVGDWPGQVLERRVG